MKVLVTGGAGYIGSHVTWALVDQGHEPVVIDDLTTGVRENLPPVPIVIGRAGDRTLVYSLMQRYGIEAVMHFAGSIVVPESIEKPLRYYENNFCQARGLLEACDDFGIESFIFSSTAAVYGSPETAEVREDTTLEPINPYGRSKKMVEHLLEDYRAASGLNYKALRYFNVAGADPDGRTGQSTPDATHLIKVACQTALGEREKLSLFGTDYDTPDGTCIRDYIHVSDLATAHILALESIANGGESGPMNCGYGHGFSVRDVIDAVKRVSGVDFEVVEADRRPGDPPALVADSSRLREELDWRPQHNDLDRIVATALAWEKKTG